MQRQTVLLSQPKDDNPSSMFKQTWDGYTQTIPNTIRHLFRTKSATQTSNTIKDVLLNNGWVMMHVHSAIYIGTTLPKNWQFLALVPKSPKTYDHPTEAEHIAKTAYKRLPTAYQWYGVTDKELLVSGFYTPDKDAIEMNNAFQDLAECLKRCDQRVKIQTNITLPTSVENTTLNKYKPYTVSILGSIELGLEPKIFLQELEDYPTEKTIIEPFLLQHRTHYHDLAQSLKQFFYLPEEVPYDIIAHLDVKINGLNWLKGFPIPTLNTIDDLEQHHNQELYTRRMQAVKAYPLLAPYFMRQVPNYIPSERETKNGENSQNADIADILYTIDGAHPLIPVLCTTLNTTPKHLRAIQGLSLDRVDGKHSTEKPDLFLQALPIENLPKSEEEYTQLKNAIRAVNDLHRVHKYYNTDHTFNEYESWKSSYALPQPETYSTHALDAWENSKLRYVSIAKAMSSYPAEILDMVKHINKFLFTPLLQHHLYHLARQSGIRELNIAKIIDQTQDRSGFTGPLISQLAEYWTLRQIVDSSSHWHKNLAHFNEALQRQKMEGLTFLQQWSPVLGTMTLTPELVVEEITSDERMQFVGKDQLHCVGGYTDDVLNNNASSITNTAVLALKNPVTNTLYSTVEIQFSNADTMTFAAIVQHKAKNNQPVDDVLKTHEDTILEAFKQAIPQNAPEHFSSIKTLNDKTRTHRVFYQGKEEHVPMKWLISGQDPRQASPIRATHTIFAQLLPKPLRDFDSLQQKVVAYIHANRQGK